MKNVYRTKLAIIRKIAPAVCTARPIGVLTSPCRHAYPLQNALQGRSVCSHPPCRHACGGALATDGAADGPPPDRDCAR